MAAKNSARLRFSCVADVGSRELLGTSAGFGSDFGAAASFFWALFFAGIVYSIVIRCAACVGVTNFLIRW